MKNSKGISLIALIITIIVIIILAAIVIGGVFNTPRDAKWAQFCSDYDTIQTATQVKYYEEYLKDQTDTSKSTFYNRAQLYNLVATNEAGNGNETSTDFNGNNLLGLGNKPTTYSNWGEWSVDTDTGVISYTTGFQRENGSSERYISPSTKTS